MHRLYVKIYLSFLAAIILAAVLAPILWNSFGPEHEDRRLYGGMATLIAHAIPPSQQPKRTHQALRELAHEFRANLTLYQADGRLLDSIGPPLPLPVQPEDSGWSRNGPHGPVISLRLPDGRWLMAAHQRHKPPRFAPWLLGLVALTIGLGIYPLARQLTRRLEHLKNGVQELGSGDLSARVNIQGKDEVAELARQFNHSAERIERLVIAQKNALATASHEFRTPLTRMQMALELYTDTPSEQLKQELLGDMAELNRLVDDVLVSSRLDAQQELAHAEELDLLALLAEEASRYGLSVSGDSAVVLGDAHLLRRLIRNLLDNARRYSPDNGIEASLMATSSEACLRICDQGPGIPEAERDKVFEPFYRPAQLAENKHGGVGLGLALVRQIAEQHGGRVQYIALEQQGSCFEVRLPRSPIHR